VLRGGSWNNNNSDNLRGANRNNNHPENRNNNIGFRVAEYLRLPESASSRRCGARKIKSRACSCSRREVGTNLKQPGFGE
jgi:hypothetical protein